MTQIEFQERLREHYEKLPVNQRHIADYISEHYEKVPFLSVQELSEATEVSVASIVRFAQRIGFSGYSELKDEVSRHLRSRMKKSDAFPLVSHSQDDESVFMTVANQDIQNINDTLRLNNPELIAKTVSIINGSNHIYTVGLGVSFLLAQILAYQLRQIGVYAHVLRNDDSTFLEQSIYFREGDSLIAFSFPPYSKDTLYVAEQAAEKKMKVIAITDRPSAPVLPFADVALLVRSQNMLFTNSFSAISVLINGLVTECARKNIDQAKATLETIQAIANQEGKLLNNGNK
jgi:DNA-binding MurR/RpiR family transcriptional regulator